jgi:hypothetical protein
LKLSKLRSAITLGLLAAGALLVAPLTSLAVDHCGKYRGTWTSCTNGHHGKLCAHLRQ